MPNNVRGTLGIWTSLPDKVNDQRPDVYAIDFQVCVLLLVHFGANFIGLDRNRNLLSCPLVSLCFQISLEHSYHLRYGVNP